MAKTKALISLVVTAKLICVFVFTYTKCWFSHDAAHMVMIICTMAPSPGAGWGIVGQTSLLLHLQCQCSAWEINAWELIYLGSAVLKA